MRRKKQRIDLVGDEIWTTEIIYISIDPMVIMWWWICVIFSFFRLNHGHWISKENQRLILNPTQKKISYLVSVMVSWCHTY